VTVPGVVAVWSSGRPRLDTYRIPPHADGLVLGRELADPSDDRISRHHARLQTQRDQLMITDLGSRNGTFINGTALIAPRALESPTVVRTGRTIFVVVRDVRPYEHVPLARRDDLVVGGTLDRTCRAVDLAAIEAEHTTLVGPRSVTRVLARGYAAALEGGIAIFDQVATSSFELAVKDVSSVRTILLELVSPLTVRDVELIAEWLETDVRFVTTVRFRAEVGWLAPAIAPRLTQRLIEIPMCRFDELPTTLHEIVKAAQPTATIHADVIEYALVTAQTLAEDTLLARFREGVERWRTGGRSTLRGDDLADLDHNMNWCFHGEWPPRRR
jgi:hypothetical protein